MAHRAYGIGQWRPDRALFDAAQEYWRHPHHLGGSLRNDRREQGRPVLYDPGRATAELVTDRGRQVGLCYRCQSCEDFSAPRVLTAAAGSS